LQVEDIGNIPAGHRHHVLSNPEDWFQYVDRFGPEGVKIFFECVSDRFVKWWCIWFHKVEELEAADRDEAIHSIKVPVDRRITENPDVPLSDAPASEWYTRTLAPAAKPHNAVLQVKQGIVLRVIEAILALMSKQGGRYLPDCALRPQISTRLGSR
jgi:hypothetical protein